MSPLFLISDLRPFSILAAAPLLAQSAPPPMAGDWQSDLLRTLMIVLVLVNIWDKLKRKSAVNECSECRPRLERPDPVPRQYPAISPKEKQERREKCRCEVLRYLAIRSLVFSRAETIRSALAPEFDFTFDEINAALKFEHGRGHISIEPHVSGATLYFSVTSEGILFHERNSLI